MARSVLETGGKQSRTGESGADEGVRATESDGLLGSAQDAAAAASSK